MSDRFYATVRALSRPVLATWFRLESQGAANIPATGPCLVVANHSSYLDPAVLGRACPRKIHFLIARTVFVCPGLQWFFRRMDAVPVSFDGSDAAALRVAMRLLSAGRVVGIFPEGGRSKEGELAGARVGAALLASHSRCPVVPVGIRGAREALPVGAMLPRPRRIEVAFGAPFVVVREGGRGQRRRLEEVGTRMMREVADLMVGHESPPMLQAEP